LAAIKTVYLYRLRSNKGSNPTTIEEARNYPIIAQRDSLDHLWLKSNGFKNIYLTPDVSQIVQLLLRGSRSLIVYSNIALPVEIKKQGGSMKQVVAVLPLFETTPYMALSLSTSDEILQRLQKAYDSLLQEGAITIIKNDEESTPPQ
jgi:polar amino acid transport system substrate-binding protein